ncbi:MAG: TIGR04372 family glycosyltransferase [Elusimicrobia bacterium]|nr:TIGR04372 family glycosyltransferase [Elusimicrobiota bacterium]
MARPKLRSFVITATKPFFLAGGLIAWLIIRLLEPWRRVRVGMLVYDRIGHLAINTEISLRESVRRRASREYTILVSGPPANRQLFEMIARRTRVWRSPWALRLFVHGLAPLIRGTRFELDLPFEGNEYETLASAGPQLSFTPAEEARGRNFLRSMGVEPGRPYICFHSRDKAYLDVLHPHRTRGEWSYHDYRDCAIENYLPAVRRIAARGIAALRMGAVAEKPLGAEPPGIIDYATKFRDDFADVYLLAHCKFMLASTSGICVVPPIFNVPVALANFTPLGYATWGPRDLFIPKTYHDASGRPMAYRRLMELGTSRWTEGNKFTEAGIAVVENTAEDITDLAEEMDARLDGRWIAEPGDEELQRRYRALFPADHPITGYPARVGAAFLRRHKSLLD